MKNRIRNLIGERGLKFCYVIEKSGLSKSSFYGVMNGTSIPKLINARKIADAIGVPLDEVFPDNMDILE